VSLAITASATRVSDKRSIAVAVERVDDRTRRRDCNNDISTAWDADGATGSPLVKPTKKPKPMTTKADFMLRARAVRADDADGNLP
jgi:hypothetical protein